MPRVENSGKLVDDWCQYTGNGASRHDICLACSHEGPYFDGRLRPYGEDEPEGQDGWQETDEGVDAEEGECELCGQKLSDEDC